MSRHLLADRVIYVVAQNFQVFRWTLEEMFPRHVDPQYGPINYYDGTTTFTNVQNGLVTRYKYLSEAGNVRGGRIDGVRHITPYTFHERQQKIVDELRYRLNMTPEEFYSEENKWEDPRDEKVVRRKLLSVFGEIGD